VLRLVQFEAVKINSAAFLSDGTQVGNDQGSAVVLRQEAPSIQRSEKKLELFPGFLNPASAAPIEDPFAFNNT
jgi:hypothetical protein